MPMAARQEPGRQRRRREATAAAEAKGEEGRPSLAEEGIVWELTRPGALLATAAKKAAQPYSTCPQLCCCWLYPTRSRLLLNLGASKISSLPTQLYYISAMMHTAEGQTFDSRGRKCRATSHDADVGSSTDQSRNLISFLRSSRSSVLVGLSCAGGMVPRQTLQYPDTGIYGTEKKKWLSQL